MGSSLRRILISEGLISKEAGGDALTLSRRAWALYHGDMDGVKERHSFDARARSLALWLDEGGEDGSKEQRAGETVQKNLQTLERQTRKWRTAWNLWYEGREIDRGRMANDMMDSLIKMASIVGKLKRVENTPGGEDLDREYTQLDSAFAKTQKAFTAAIKALRS